MFPVKAVTQPALLHGQANGELSTNVLTDTPGLGGGPTVRLAQPAARAWRALCAAAHAAGITLQASSLTDSYRPLAVQERIFRERYTTDFLANRPSRTWQGKQWYQRPNTATAAVPGTSNHGWGLAVDVEDASGTRLQWLLDHADTYGWSWEIQSEPWHIHYWPGDNTPAAVRNTPTPTTGGDDVSGEDVWNFQIGSPALGGRWADGEAAGEYLKFAVSGAAEVSVMHGELTAMRAELTALRGVVETLASAITTAGGTVDTAAILAGVDERLATFRAQIKSDTQDVVDHADGGAPTTPTGTN